MKMNGREYKMQYRKFAKNDHVSILGFGMMRFPNKEDGSIDEELLEKMVDYAYENGVNYFDTAQVYYNDKSEILTGKILSKYPRNSYYVTDKLSIWVVNSLEELDEFFNNQLRKLQVDYIDYYLLHALNKEYWEKIINMGAMDYIVDKYEKGIIKNLGFSFHDDYETFEKIIKYRKWDFCQIQYNYLDTEVQAGDRGYKLAEELGVELVIMEPNKGGLLCRLPETCVEEFKNINPDASQANWALRWLWSKTNCKVVLSGMSDMEQTIDNVNSANLFEPLTEVEQEAVKKVRKAILAAQRNGCTGCEYCMPCPFGVNIPRNFRIWNMGALTGNYEKEWKRYSQLADADASHCMQCGSCEAVCPQSLNIISDLASLHKEITDYINNK